ncbi:uncharacterized protein G2W53_043782 [Senna tora]|uniref:Uncharacterized protein n=1 Tax=Senna tora TaxID=362788 RepID=A0A834SJN7_9FABA|nr:uncharacterized protein G2W53_043782 [Senna tora]
MRVPNLQLDEKEEEGEPISDERW